MSPRNVWYSEGSAGDPSADDPVALYDEADMVEDSRIGTTSSAVKTKGESAADQGYVVVKVA